MLPRAIVPLEPAIGAMVDRGASPPSQPARKAVSATEASARTLVDSNEVNLSIELLDLKAIAHMELNNAIVEAGRQETVAKEHVVV